MLRSVVIPPVIVRVVVIPPVIVRVVFDPAVVVPAGVLPTAGAAAACTELTPRTRLGVVAGAAPLSEFAVPVRTTAVLMPDPADPAEPEGRAAVCADPPVTASVPLPPRPDITTGPPVRPGRPP